MNPVIGFVRSALQPLGIALPRPDTLTDHDPPRVIDYTSIDTEGGELGLLQAFDSIHHRPQILTVEHNDRPDRADMVALMTAKGCVRAPLAVSAEYDRSVCATVANRLPDLFLREILQNG